MLFFILIVLGQERRQKKPKTEEPREWKLYAVTPNRERSKKNNHVPLVSLLVDGRVAASSPSEDSRASLWPLQNPTACRQSHSLAAISRAPGPRWHHQRTALDL